MPRDVRPWCDFLWPVRGRTQIGCVHRWGSSGRGEARDSPAEYRTAGRTPQCVPFAVNHGALNGTLELPYVAGPVIVHQCRHGRCGWSMDRLAHTGTSLRKERGDQGRMSSFRSRSGGRWIRATGIPIQQIGAKDSLGNILAQIVMRGRQNTHVDFLGLVSPSRVTSFSCSTRSRWVWTVWGISPISSRKSTPPCAASNSPG